MSGIIPGPARVLRREGTFTLPAHVRFGGAFETVSACGATRSNASTRSPRSG